MNKKFSTLVASAMLAMCASPVLAQDPAPVADPLCGNPAGFDKGVAFQTGDGIDAKLYYNLVNDAADKYLSVDITGGTFTLKMVPQADLTSLAKIDEALWKVEPQVSGDGGVVRFNFTNKATGFMIAFDSNVAVNANATTPAITADAYNLAGSMPQWKWYDNAYNVTPTDFTVATPLSVAYANGDSTLTLGVDANNAVYAYKYANNAPAPAVPQGAQLAVKIQNAGTYVMSAADLNTKVSGATNVKYMQLNFPQVTVDNVFGTKLQAQELAVTAGATQGVAATFSYNIDASKGYANEDLATPAGYVILNQLDENDNVSGKLVHVDTAYYASRGATYKLYNQIAVTNAAATLTTGTANSYDKLATGLPLSAFRFKFTKNLANDSIWVQAGVEAVEMATQQPAINNPAANAYTMWDYATSTTDAVTTGKAEDVKNGDGKNLILSHCTLQDETKKVVTFYECDGTKEVNRVNLLGADGIAYDYASLAEGVYVVTVRNSARKEHAPGAYAFDKLCGVFGYSNQEPKINPLHMPAYHWIVEKVVRTGEMANVSPVRIINREFVDSFYDSPAGTIFQFKKGADLKENELVLNGDTLTFTKIDGAATASYGYFNLSKEDAEHTIYNFEYLSALAEGLKINVGAQDDVLGPDTILTVNQDGARFRLIPVEINKTTAIAYGYNGAVTEGTGLKRTAYYLQINDANKLGNDHKYVGASPDVLNMDRYIVTPNVENALPFYLKEQNCVDGKHYYALVEVGYNENATGLVAFNKASVDDVSAQLRVENLCGETRTSSFAIAIDSTIIYRELNGNNTIVVEPGAEPYTAPCVANFFRSRIVDKEYLFESANQGQFNEIGKGINYLGVRLEDKTFDDSTAIYVDTADIRNPFKPQYMMAVGVTVTPAGKYCPIHGFNSGCKDEHLTDVPAHVWGRYLINAQDSVNAKPANVADYQWEGQYTRLVFVPALHVGDTLIVFRRGEFPRTSENALDYLKAMEWARTAVYDAKKAIYGVADSVFVMNVKDRNVEAGKTPVQDDANYKFAYRLVNDDKRDFIIESHDGVADNVSNPAKTYKAVKIQNGVPVVAQYATANEGILNAEWFNLDDRRSTPTANDAISATEVSIVAANGTVTIKGAAGKSVAITNVLGKALVNTVLASDSETIEVPTGMVVVSVEGEEAVKAIVK